MAQARKSPAFVWGMVGERDDFGVLSAATTSEGIRRHVIEGVEYSPPPVDVMPAWKRGDDGEQDFYFELDAPPDHYPTLADLAANLRADDAARLAELDRAVTDLIAACGKLHENGWTVGLLCPQNVRFGRPPADPRLLFTDLGFHHASDFSQPEWLQDNSHFAPLWKPATPRQRQRVPGEAVADAEVDAAADTAVLARTIACALTGRPQADPKPGTAAGFNAGVGPAAVTTADQLWAVLARAAAGNVATPDELAQLLAECPPSSHFAPKVVGRRASTAAPKPKSRTAPAAVVVAIVAAVVGVAIFWHRMTGSSVTRDDVHKAIATPFAKRADEIGKLYDTPPANRAEVDGELTSARADYLKEWQGQLKALAERMATRPAELVATYAELNALIAALESLHAKPAGDHETLVTAETTALANARRLSDQLRSRR